MTSRGRWLRRLPRALVRRLRRHAAARVLARGPAEPRGLRARVRQLPRLAAFGFGAILVLTIVLGATSQRALHRLQRELYPSLEATAVLRDLVGQTRAALQDAVEVGDEDRLRVAEARRMAIDTALARAHALAPGDSAALGVVAGRVRAYYAAAHAGAVAMLAPGTALGVPGGDAERLVARMVQEHRALDEALAARADAQRAAIEDAFDRAALAQASTWGGIVVAALLALAVLAGRARQLARDLVQPLGAAMAAASRLAEGDLSVTVPRGRADEVGALLDALRGTVAYLRETSAAADAIAAGDVGASAAPRSPRDRLGTAFAAMTAYLQETAHAAERLARGDPGLAIVPRSPRDAFGRSLGLTLERLTGTIVELRASEARLRAAEEATRTREARFRALVQESSDVIAVIDAERTVQYVSPSVERVIGLPAAAVLGRRVGPLVHEEDRPLLDGALARVLVARGATARVQLRLAHEGGEWRHVECAATNLLHEPAVAGIVVNARDVSERTALEAQLTHQAYHDPLTGLANRALFRNRVAQALRAASRAADRSVAVLFVDLDDFKTVNDSLGHHAGDQLLQTVAARLLNATRGCDTVARLGGDEFAILIEHVRDAGDALAVVERVLGALHRPVPLEGRDVRACGSLGVALAAPGDTADDLLRNADVAMYGAKADGKGGYRVFDASLLEAAMDRIELESAIAGAADRGELAVAYQPIVALATGEVAGVEALLRWQHPTRGAIPPARFIPIAESTGHIVALGRWVLRAACREAAAWPPRRDGTPRTVSVNLSGRQLAEPGLVDDVRRALADAGLAATRLTLEITESVLMHDTERNLAQLRALKALGVRLAIDDFGTGYSSLSYLQRFPVDVLKIDRSFVEGIPGGGHDAALASLIVALGRMLSLRTVAEGIETEAQRDHLATLGCEFGQGYLFARPLAAAALLERLEAERREAERCAAERATSALGEPTRAEPVLAEAALVG